MLHWGDIENEYKYSIKVYKDNVYYTTIQADQNDESLDLTYILSKTAGNYTATVAGIVNWYVPGDYWDGEDSMIPNVYSVVSVTAELSPITSATGTTIMTLGQAIPDLEAEDIVISKRLEL